MSHAAGQINVNHRLGGAFLARSEIAIGAGRVYTQHAVEGQP